jgi:hypothetical protein
MEEREKASMYLKALLPPLRYDHNRQRDSASNKLIKFIGDARRQREIERLCLQFPHQYYLIQVQVMDDDYLSVSLSSCVC